MDITKELCEQALLKLRERADERAVRVWARMGMPTETYLGVSLTNIKAIAKDFKRSNDLAHALWATGVHDARLLATYLAEPKKLTRDDADRWVRESDFIDLSDKIATNVVAKMAVARDCQRDWIESQAVFVRRAGWMLLYNIAYNESLFDAASLAQLLARIESKIHSEHNWVREAMNSSVIAIGQRADMHSAALKTARRIGPVDVDYGDTSCKAPDAVGYLTNPKLLARIGIGGANDV